MIELDAASFLLQWAVGGLFVTWVTTRRREVGLGYGWTMRITFGLMAAASILVSTFLGRYRSRRAAVGVMATAFAQFVSVRRKEAGVAGQREVVELARVAAAGIDRDERFDARRPSSARTRPDRWPSGSSASSPRDRCGLTATLSVARILIGAAFLAPSPTPCCWATGTRPARPGRDPC